MKKLLQLMLATTIACNAQELTKGYTAVQFGILDGQVRVRSYTNVGLKTDMVHVDYQGLNEASSGYLFGRESLRVGLNGFPVEAIVATRITGSLCDTKLLDTAYGARFAIPKSTKLYGFVDTVKHTGMGVSGYRGLESVIFVGKGFKGWNFETTQAFRKGGYFHEVEVLTPAVNRGITWRGFSRYESPHKDLTFGLQGQF